MQPGDIQPLRLTRTVRWGDCDPAGIIYTPRVLDYAMETLETWNREILGVPWIKLNRELSMGFPTVRVEMDFISAPAVDDEVVLELKVEKLGHSSLTSIVTGHDGSGTIYFHVKVISCLVSVPAYKSTEIPDQFRQRILAYQDANRDNA
ncbi:MAG: acyl-CoA thioesterase [Rhodospirillaceae bacterium]|nr:acyl-CoA thioesterase [Rhodospirillaceae bacterium]